MKLRTGLLCLVLLAGFCAHDDPVVPDCPEIIFAHKNGFIAKTRENVTLDDLVTLVGKAVTGP